jgi:hypothetical protein
VTEHLKSHYEKPAEMYDGLRLHQNENTGGCSPRVLEALARLTRENLGFYPPLGGDRRGVEVFRCVG